MDLIDEENIPGVQVGQQCRQVAGLFNGRAGGDADACPHLVGDDTGQCGLAKTRRAVKQHMVQRFAAPPGRLNVDGEISFGLLLAGVVPKKLGPQADFRRVLGGVGGQDQSILRLLRKFQTHRRLSFHDHGPQGVADHILCAGLRVYALQGQGNLGRGVAQLLQGCRSQGQTAA